MKRQIFVLLFATVVAMTAWTQSAPRASADICGRICDCENGCCNCGLCDCGYMLPVHRARWYNWNRNYAHTSYGMPVAMVVPPTANLQTNWGWGVASSRISRIDHQVQRNYPGAGPYGGPFRPTPVWPSDTTQFGVYYVRGPW